MNTIGTVGGLWLVGHLPLGLATFVVAVLITVGAALLLGAAFYYWFGGR